jgi:cytochrome c553
MRIFVQIIVLQLVIISSSAVAGSEVVGRCVTCHGVDGKSGRSNEPNLAAQNKAYIVKQINDYASGNRKFPTMESIAKGLIDQEIDEIATYYRSLPALELWANPNSIEMGKYVYEGKITAQGFPSCIGCHGENGMRNSMAGIPKLSGQNSSYLYTEIM